MKGYFEIDKGEGESGKVTFITQPVVTEQMNLPGIIRGSLENDATFSVTTTSTGIGSSRMCLMLFKAVNH